MKEFFKIILYKPLFNLLVFFAWLVPGHSVGWAIILLTLLVRVVLWKTSVHALIAPMKMRQYQPELKAIQERHKDDRNAAATAQMAFYKEKGISPLSGCLPLLIQLPILIILYRVFIVGLNQIRPDLIYSFTPHLSTINPVFLGINLGHPDKLFILPALAAILQFVQAKHMQSLNPAATSGNDPAAAMSKQMIYLLPAMTLFIAYRLPSGLALYWVTTTLFSLLQQLYVAKTFKPAPEAQLTVRTKKR